MVEETGREVAMERLAAVIGECRKCPLFEDAHHAVPGEGAVGADLMLIGEAPGKQEDLTGRPFVGRAGKLLECLLSGIGLSRDDVFIANIVKHRPPGNRDPEDEEIRACTPYLEEQIRIVGPKVIVMLGRHSSRYILSFLPVEFDRITEIRGTVYPAVLFGHPVRLIPTLHPAAALYNPAYREALEEDFRVAGRELAEGRGARDTGLKGQ
ncbi:MULTISPECIES: type-4 uracil-DNA glycosylase [unclassified Methanoculleus]|jgi:DNA polymerase|uniref:Type-4 uracil-DNA glycosylase n=1 Tax=Methanoculleus palmolei TaxID=72612 RepID=A0ABD8A9U7_9EURY|nr:type-4 uracil-DNA glycosylase [Methanoculleus sp. UBA377]WOX56298.1 type-4 uracil-DNA glycosylase [Methanoculleus palmolei]